jgi:hypothetical protein
MRFYRAKFLAVSVSWLYLVGCGEDSNVNSLFVSKKQAEAVDVLMSEAELAYDQGDFETAKEKAEKAFSVNTQNEKVAVLLGYIYLSYAGIDPFQLSKSLISGSTKSKSTTAESSSTSAAGQLGSLASILNVDHSQLTKLGLTPCASGVESTTENPCREDITTPAEFEDYPVLHPKPASKARESGIDALTYAMQAVKTICPFVGDDVLISDDPRHVREAGGSCPASPVPTRYGAKVNFLWAFAHIADALILYNVLLYTNADATEPNLDIRARLVKESAGNISTYLRLAGPLAKDVAAIFQASNADSALNGVLNSLSAAGKAFAQIGPGAETFTAGIDKALASLKAPSTTGGQEGASSTVLQSQLTGNVAKSLNTKLETLKTTDRAAYDANKTEICNLFETITGGEGTTKPSDC